MSQHTGRAPIGGGGEPDETAEERARECLRLNQSATFNDSQMVPIDIEERIAAAIREAEEARAAKVYEECAQLADTLASGYEAAHDEAVAGNLAGLMQISASKRTAALDLAFAIRARARGDRP